MKLGTKGNFLTLIKSKIYRKYDETLEALFKIEGKEKASVSCITSAMMPGKAEQKSS